VSTDFDSELDSIVGAYRAADDAARQQQASNQAAAAAFAKAWEACRNGVVRPALTEIVTKLAGKDVGAQISDTPGGGVSLSLPTPGIQQRVRNPEHPQLVITPSAGPMNVTFKYVGAGAARQSTYTVDQVTREAIQNHVLQLVRSVYANHG
jgi:hypothetical protein